MSKYLRIILTLLIGAGVTLYGSTPAFAATYRCTGWYQADTVDSYVEGQVCQQYKAGARGEAWGRTTANFETTRGTVSRGLHVEFVGPDATAAGCVNKYGTPRGSSYGTIGPFTLTIAPDEVVQVDSQWKRLQNACTKTSYGHGTVRGSAWTWRGARWHDTDVLVETSTIKF